MPEWMSREDNEALRRAYDKPKETPAGPVVSEVPAAGRPGGRRMSQLRLGTTGPRTGGSVKERARFVDLLLMLCPYEFHHGDCVGWDAQCHDLVRQWLPECKIVGHPPGSPEYRAFKSCDRLEPERPYLERNRIIVAQVHVMCGPKVEKGGTGYTRNWTRQQDKGLIDL